MSYTICSRFKGEHIVYAGYTICTSREHIVYGAFCGSTGQLRFGLFVKFVNPVQSIHPIQLRHILQLVKERTYRSS